MGVALSMLMIDGGVGWPQTSPPSSLPSSLGVQTPAQQAAPDRPAPVQGEPAPSSAPPEREDNPGLINDKLCQAKGIKEGKSLDTDAAEKCSAKVYLPGYKRGPGDCRTENYVTRALCQ